ncbi:hypothetical protein [Acinetobacter sp. YH1901134]|uniref:hypothetical protein n=1 Tax=Acinetobacter sp. YH1901134 TaxID=2601199 RepID=UPI0015D372DC|nr:hypothetical protein [Acinetobacter sp. YH1901134]
MKYEEIEKLLEEEREILAMHKQNLDDFIDQGFNGFVSKDELREMLSKGEQVWDKYKTEMNRLVSEIQISGLKVMDLNLKLKNYKV